MNHQTVGRPNLKKKGRPPLLTKFQTEQLRLMIASLYLKGKSQAEIAEVASRTFKAKVDRYRIIKELKVIEADWASKAVMDLNEARAKELAKLDTLEMTFWEGWERSLKPAVSQDIKDGTSSKGPYSETKTSRSGIAGRPAGREGNPSFLDGVYKCIDRRIKLLGLDAPTKIDITETVRTTAASMGLDPDEAVKEVERMLGQGSRPGGTHV